MSEKQKKTFIRALLGLAAVVVTILVLMNGRSALSWVGSQAPAEKAAPTDQQTAAKAAKVADQDARKEYVENAPWMAPGIPMTERLRQISEDRSRLFKFWVQPEAIDTLAKQLETETVPEKQVMLLTKMSASQFQCGRTADG